MAASVNGVVFPPGPLLLKHIASNRYLTETQKVLESPDPMFSAGQRKNAIRASEQYPCDLNGLVNILKHDNNHVKIQQVTSGRFWQVSTLANQFGGKSAFWGLILPNAASDTDRHIFTPIQDMSTGQIHFKAYDGTFMSLGDDNFITTGGKDYLHHGGAFLVELGLLKRVMKNVEYHLDKAHTVESVAKVGQALSLDNPSNSVEQLVSRKHTETVAESSRWETSSTIATSVTISASIPLYAGEGSVSIEKSHAEEHTVATGEAVITTLEIVDELSAKVPPAYKIDASLQVITGTVRIPFSYSVTDYYLDGQIENHGDKRFDDGMFEGVTLHTTIWNVDEVHAKV